MTATPADEQHAARMRKRGVVVHLFVIAAVVGIAYCQSFDGPFVLDDVHLVETMGSAGAYKSMPLPLQNFRSMGYFSFWLNYNLHETDVFGYHVVNLLIHIATAIALYDCVRGTLLLPVFDDEYRNRASAIAYCAALLWAVHPLQTQAVTYIAQRFEALMAFWFLLSIGCFVRAQTEKRGWLWLIASALAMLLSLSTKEVSVMIPAVLVLYDRAFVSTSWKCIVRRWLPVAPVAGMGSLVVAAKAIPLLYSSPWVGFGSQSHPAVDYWKTQPEVILHYLRLCFVPVGQSLDYRWPVASGWWSLAAASAIFLLLLVGSVYAFIIRPRVGLLPVVFFLILSVSSLVPMSDIAMEHRMYLPSACLAVLLVVGLDRLMQFAFQQKEHALFALYGISLAAAGVLGFFTFQRNETYNTRLSVWSNVVELNPHNDRGWTQLADAFLDRGEIDEAVRCLKQATAIAPHEFRANAELSLLYSRNTRLDPKGDQAKKYAEIAFSSAPEQFLSNYAMGISLTDRRKFTEALPHWEFAVMKRPASFEVVFGYGNALLEADDIRKAAEAFQTAANLEPENEAARTALQQTVSELETGKK